MDNIALQEEEKACNYFISELVNRGKDASLFKIERRSDDYTTLLYGINDFLRVHYGVYAKWLSIAISEEDAEVYKNSSLFSSQENKGQRHWISYIKDFNELPKYIDLADHACIFMQYGTSDRTLTAEETAVCDYIRKLFIDCGADPDQFYIYLTKTETALIYKSLASIRFKIYGKKPGYIVRSPFLSKYRLPKDEKGRIPFNELSDLDRFKKKIIPDMIEAANDYNMDMSGYIKYPIT